jgi:hypothetical protein
MTDAVQTGSVATPAISQSDIESLERLYTFRGKAEVVQFLEKYPFLVATLQSAPEQIRRHFPDEQLFLQVVHDPEIVNCADLVLSILTGRQPEGALDRLNHLDKEWELGLPYEVRKVFLINLEFPDEF